ncbi:hypothetical protein E2320_016590 [Naja naja]|nr:hypothetical protein E2320_016590 [Naja naja]
MGILEDTVPINYYYDIHCKVEGKQRELSWSMHDRQQHSILWPKGRQLEFLQLFGTTLHPRSCHQPCWQGLVEWTSKPPHDTQLLNSALSQDNMVQNVAGK